MKRRRLSCLAILLTLAVAGAVGPSSAQAKRGWWGIQSDAGGAWTNAATTVTFSTYGPAPAGDVWYSTDAGASWTKGGSVSVAAPSDHSNDGVHDIEYRFVDGSANVLRSGFCQVKIDTTGPDCFAPGVSCVEGGVCRIPFLIADCRYLPENQILPFSPTAHATLAIYRNAKIRGKWTQVPLRTVDLGWRPTNVFAEESWIFYDWPCDLPPGGYWYEIRATDEAGNPHNHADDSPLTVTRS